MNLKEAFRYQNKLQALMDEAQNLLGRDSNVTRVQNTYKNRVSVSKGYTTQSSAAIGMACAL